MTVVDKPAQASDRSGQTRGYAETGASLPKLLFLAAEIPWPLDVGQKTVTYNDLLELQRHFDIDLVSYIDENNPRANEVVDELAKRLERVNVLPPIPHPIYKKQGLALQALTLTEAMVRRMPYTTVKYRSKEYLATAARLLDDVDYSVVYVDHIHPSYVLAGLEPRRLEVCRLVYRAHDATFEAVSSFAGRLGRFAGAIGRVHARQCLRYERRLWARCDLTFSVTRRLDQMIRRECPSDCSKFSYWPVPVELLPHRKLPSVSEPRLLYLGTVRYPPNMEGLQWFITNCWNSIREQVPNARFDIVGKGSEFFRHAAPAITVHGYVEDPGRMWAQADVLVVPLFAGSGVRIKILDAFSQGVPVVSTTAGFAGLEVENGRELLAADDAEGLIGAVARLLKDPANAEAMVAAGRGYLKTHHNRELAQNAITRLSSMLAGVK